MVGQVVDGRPDHLSHVRDRLVAGCADQRGRGGVPVVRPGFEELFGRVVLGSDLAEPRLVPREKRPADPPAADLGVEEADLLVHVRAVRLLVPPDAAVRDGDAVDLGDEEVALRIAAVEVVVPRRERLRGLDAVVSFTARRRVDDPCEVLVVGRAPERPEHDTVQLGKSATWDISVLT